MQEWCVNILRVGRLPGWDEGPEQSPRLGVGEEEAEERGSVAPFSSANKTAVLFHVLQMGVC